MSAGLIVALDFHELGAALSLVDQLSADHCALKVGSEMFTLFGPDFVKQLIQRGFKVFLDLKFHDIPNTVASACKAAADMGVWMVNVHAVGGPKMMEAAQTALLSYGQQKPLLIAVTVLTSMNQEQLQQTGIAISLNDQVKHLTQMASNCGLDGVVCSAFEVEEVKLTQGADFLTVTPGIRLADSDVHDQVRVMTPERASQAGSDYLVIGRAITQADNPMTVVNEVIKSIK